MKLITLLFISLLGYTNPSTISSDPPSVLVESNVESNELSKGAEIRLRKDISKFALKFKGKSYGYGANGPNKFDCSGYTSFIYHHFNVRLDRSSNLQSKQGKQKRISQLKPADLVFFGTQTRIQHVGIVLEANKGRLVMIHCSSSRGVVIEDVYQSVYWKDRILFGKDVINN